MKYVSESLGFSDFISYQSLIQISSSDSILQPVEEIFQRLKGISHDPSEVVPRILLHTDAAQTIGKIRVDVDSLNADYLTIVGHKVGDEFLLCFDFFSLIS